MEDVQAERPSDVLAAEVAELARRITTYRADGAVDPQLVLAELDTAHEELRVAEEEVRAQHEELTRLTRSYETVKAARERFTAMLPVPVLISDSYGTIRSANLAASTRLGVPVNRLRGKPVFTYLEADERTEVRRLLAHAIAHMREGFHTTVGLVPRTGGPTTVDLAATIRWQDVEALEVMWAMVTAQPGGGPRPDVGTQMARALAELVQASPDLDRGELLRQVARCCEQAFLDPVAASVSVGDPANPEFVATSSALAQHLDGIQLMAGEGPCSTAFEHRQTVVSPDLRSDPRWPRFAARLAAEEPVAAVALPIDSGAGVLNMYIRTSSAPDFHALTEGGMLLAGTVAAVLREAEMRTDLESLARQLRQALDSRAAIDQAKGIVMATNRCSADEAFEILVRASTTTNVKLREVARRLVDQASSSDGRRAGPREGLDTTGSGH